MRYRGEWLLVMVVVLSGILAGRAQADVITLRNKQMVEGVILDENDSRIVIDVGFGQVAFGREEIDSIARSALPDNQRMQEEWKRAYFASYPAPSPRDQQLLDRYKEIAEQYDTLTRRMIRKEGVVRDLARLDEEIGRLQQNVLRLGQLVKATDPKQDAVRYNRLIAELNNATIDLRDGTAREKILKSEYEQITSSANVYINVLLEYERQAESRFAEVARAVNTPEQAAFYEQFRERISQLGRGLHHEELPLSADRRSILATVVLNGRSQAKLLVDTGAMITVISEDLAHQAGIDYAKSARMVELVVADGRKITAPLVVLDTVRVGDIEVRAVEAAVIRERPSEQTQGLLGMSFLKHVSFMIDHKKERLTFYSFQ